MDADHEFYSIHLPHLISYVVPVLQRKNGVLELGSGVLVNSNGRHFVATAKHCIDADVRVCRSNNPLQRSGTTGTRELRIIDCGWHDSLDLGYLEIADPECAELSWNQLSNDKIVGGMVQFVGYPVTLVQATSTHAGQSTDISLAPGTFGTTLKDEEEDRITFDYPRIGLRYDELTQTWSESNFPESPHGFSGGACFGVEKKSNAISEVYYKLLAIQSAWNKRDSVFAVPIKRWCELMTQRGLV